MVGGLWVSEKKGYFVVWGRVQGMQGKGDKGVREKGVSPTRNRFRHGKRRAFHLYQAWRIGDKLGGCIDIFGGFGALTRV